MIKVIGENRKLKHDKKWCGCAKIHTKFKINLLLCGLEGLSKLQTYPVRQRHPEVSHVAP